MDPVWRNVQPLITTPRPDKVLQRMRFIYWLDSLLFPLNRSERVEIPPHIQISIKKLNCSNRRSDDW